jgi:hypothetical protein
MSISYVLFENNLTDDPNDYMAMVQPTGTAELDNVIQRMIERGSTVTKADILSVLEEYYSAIESMVLEGLNVNTPMANYGASIKGIFNGATDSYDPSRHQVAGTINSGKRYRKTIRERAQTTKREARKPTPNLIVYVDVNSGERDSLLTLSGMGQIIGHRLKFDPTDPAQGIFLIGADGVEVKITTVGKNTPGELMFLIPPMLPPGEYTLQVRAAVYDGEQVRNGTLNAILTVV